MTSPVRIEAIRAGDQLYKIRLTGSDNWLTISGSVFHRFRLKEGIVLTEAQVVQLRREGERSACEATANRMLAIREHTVGELRVKLRRKQYGREAIDAVIKSLLQQGLLDDAHVATKLVDQSLRRNPSGQAYLIALLRRKHVDRELAESTVRRALAETDEVTLAVASLKKRWSSLSQLELERARTRAYHYLSRRGIGYQAARQAFEQLYQQEQEATED